MSTIPQQIQALKNNISSLRALVNGSRDQGKFYAMAGDFAVFGCKITQGTSALDMYLAMEGQAAGDDAHENPDIAINPIRHEEYPNIAFIYGELFEMSDVNASDTSSDALLLDDAPATAGYGRYDLVYAYVGQAGPAVAILTGTASASVKTDFDANGIDGAVYPSAYDPTLPHGTFPLARVYVQVGDTGIANARIADIRDFNGRLNARSEGSNSSTITAFNSSGLSDGVTIFFSGRDTANDGGGGWFTFSSGSVATADGGIVFAPTGGGRLLRDGWASTGFVGEVKVSWFGSAGDGVTDDTSVFQAAIDYVYGSGGGIVTYDSTHYLASTITVKDYVSLQGPLDISEELLPGTSAAYQTKNGALILNSAATITLNDSASIGGGIIVRSGMTLPFADASAATSGVAAFAGTAITVAGAGAYIHHMLILGFTRAIDSSAYERTRCEYVFGDCTNGIRLATVYDIAYVENCHFWPFTTVHQTWTTDTLLTRTGTAYDFNSVGDWSKLTNCFSYGYAVGFDINSCDHMQMIGCGSDYPSVLSSTSIGARVQGTSRDALLLGYQCAAQGTGILINSTASDKLAARIIGADCWNNDTYHIRVQDGSASIIGCTATDGSVGVLIDSTSDGSLVDDCTFSRVTTPISITGAVLEKSTIGRNRFINCVDSSIGLRHTFDNQADTETISSYNTSTTGYDLVSRYARGSAATPTISQNGDVALSISGRLHDGSVFADVARLRMAAAAAPGSGSTPGRLIFSTTPSGSTTLVDRIIVESNGDLLPLLTASYSLGASSNRWSNAYIDTLRPGGGSAKWTSGAGSPEGVLTAVVGSMYTRTDGGANTTLYIKESGTGNTGWVAK